MSDLSIDTLIAVAREATQVGSKNLVSEYNAIASGEKSLNIEAKTSHMDLVTEVDKKTQERIVDAIQKHFPDHRFIAEEEGAEDIGSPDSPYEWIIDPLDGTTNFIHAKENFGTIVTVQKDGELLAGAMHIPLLDQWFWGGKGEGAYFNGDAATLRNTRDMKDAVLNCNLIHRAKEIDGVLHVTVPECASIENTGCAIDEVGEILRGHTDGVFWDGVRLWDLACGFLLVEEAGGKMRYEAKEPGNPKGGYICAASTAPIFDDLWEWVKKKM